jgi:hypothetical protein
MVRDHVEDIYQIGGNLCLGVEADADKTWTRFAIAARFSSFVSTPLFGSNYIHFFLSMDGT